MSEAHKNISKDILLVNYDKNQIIYKQGDPGDCFYYILSGIVEVLMKKKLLSENENYLNYKEIEFEVFNKS